MSVKVGDVATKFCPAWLDGERPYMVDFAVNQGWEPSAEYAREQGARRGDIVALARITKRVVSTWKSRTPGSDNYHDVPNWSEPTFEYLRKWRWTGRNWKAI